MKTNAAKLIDYVRRMITAGARKIVIPTDLIQQAIHEILDATTILCKLNGLEPEARGQPCHDRIYFIMQARVRHVMGRYYINVRSNS